MPWPVLVAEMVDVNSLMLCVVYNLYAPTVWLEIRIAIIIPIISLMILYDYILFYLLSILL